MALPMNSTAQSPRVRMRGGRGLACRIVLTGIVVLLWGCGHQGDRDDESVVWRSEGENLEFASVTVPLSYDDPSGPAMQLALVKVPAGDPSRRIGTIVTNPGGPGASGVEFLTYSAADAFPAVLRDRFDLVAFDPRGVGGSSPVNCLDELDAYFATDLTPDDTAEYRAMVENARLMADACWEKNGDLLRHVDTMDVVRDLEQIRLALGDEPLNYVGFSYGTKIGALYAEHYPEHIRAMVLDGVMPPSIPPEEDIQTQDAGFESAMSAFLSWCGGKEDCAFGAGDPSSAFTDLTTRIDQHPLAASEGRTLGPGETSFGVSLGLYSPDFWPYLAHALAAAEAGDGGPLLRLSDLYLGRAEDGTYDDVMEAHLAVMCSDAPWPSLDGFKALAEQETARFPYLGASNLNSYLSCALWPVEPVSQSQTVRGAGAPPIMLIGTTNDPATPYAWATDLAAQMESAVLVTLEGEGHVAMGRRNACIDETVDTYLIDLALPGAHKRCSETPLSASAFRASGTNPPSSLQRWRWW